MSAWEEALGKVASYDQASVKEVIESVSKWNAEALEHVWYLGKEGLVHQISEKRTSLNDLGVRLLEWLAEPD